MERVNYTASGNTIGLSIKYPSEVNRKWSECQTDVTCEECGSESIESDISGDILTITCLNCSNWWSGYLNDVLTWHKTEEAYIYMWKIPFSDEPDF